MLHIDLSFLDGVKKRWPSPSPVFHSNGAALNFFIEM